MSTLRRILSSRANGRRSLGPVTPEGKRHSSLNSLTHGLLARIVLMQDESPEAFQQLLDDHLLRFGPVDGVEFGFVEEMTAAAWRLRRAWAMETRMLDNQVADPPDSAAGDSADSRLDRMAAVHSDPDAQRSIDLLARYETRLHMMYQRALHNLLLVRALDMPNEPNPISGHTVAEPVLPALPAPADEEPGQ